MSDATRSFWTRTWTAGMACPVLLERYQVLGVLGKGGMGTVFKAFHQQLKRAVAIKTLRLDGVGQPQLVARFVREMEAVGQMDHANVVRAFDAGEKNGVFYLVMEFLDGADLEHIVRRRGRLSVADACELTRQAALGLDYAHAKLIHRDVKPSNLLLTTGGVVKVLDLGLARFDDLRAGANTPEGHAVGTHDYVAPEQAVGDAIDGRADVYALGCTLFKLLVGRAPYSGSAYDTVAKKMFAHCHIPLAEVAGFASLPAEVAAVLVRMTAKDPGERYASAGEAARALAPLAVGSDPLRLFADRDASSHSSIHPLPDQLPEELSRLTDLPRDTPLNTLSGRLLGALTTPRPARTFLGVGVVAAVLAVLAWFVVPRWLAPSELGQASDLVPVAIAVPDRAPAPTGWRALDDLQRNTFHVLLDRQPIRLGANVEQSEHWRWDGPRQLLDVKGPEWQVFLLGTTTRPRFDFEVSIAQTPWTGRAGVFWGYRQDDGARKARVPDTDFARFQMLLLWHVVDLNGQPKYSVSRASGALGFDQHGEMWVKPTYHHDHALPPQAFADGAKVLEISFFRNHLHRAMLGSHELANLCTDEANQNIPAESYAGGVGVISLGHSATFSKARFLLR